jgi:hypothetical protein
MLRLLKQKTLSFFHQKSRNDLNSSAAASAFYTEKVISLILLYLFEELTNPDPSCNRVNTALSAAADKQNVCLL